METSPLFVYKMIPRAHDARRQMQTCLPGQADTEFPSAQRRAGVPGMESKGQCPASTWGAAERSKVQPCTGAQGSTSGWGRDEGLGVCSLPRVRRLRLLGSVLGILSVRVKVI